MFRSRDKSRPIRGQYYLGGDGEHEDPEDHRDLLVEVFLLAQEQPRSLEPAQSEHEEHFIEQRQRVCNQRMSRKYEEVLSNHAFEKLEVSSKVSCKALSLKDRDL